MAGVTKTKMKLYRDIEDFGSWGNMFIGVVVRKYLNRDLNEERE